MAGRPVQRVLMTADAVGGVWTYTRELTGFLRERGVETLVAVMGEAPREPLPGVEVAHNPVNLEWQDGAAEESYRESVRWLKELARGFQPEAIHLNGYMQAAREWNVPVLLVAHSCVPSWWRAVHGEPAPAAWDGYRRRVSEALARVDRVIAPTRAMLRNLTVDYGFRAERGGVIGNATGLARQRRAKEPLIVAAGRRWDEAKNLAMLEDIAEELTWPLEIAGGGLDFGAITELMARAWIFAHPALYEPFGLSALEAARSGCALVLADIPSLRELWDGAALFVDARDRTGWVQAINTLSADPVERGRLAEQAYSRSLAFTRERFGNAYLKEYEALTGGTREVERCA